MTTSADGREASEGRRARTLDDVTSAILALRSPGRVVRVAVDGVDGAGKTTFADEVAALLGRRGATVLRASVDDFHHPREIRHARGRDSPEGFFRDSYDYPSLRRLVIEPLLDGGNRRVVLGIHDVESEAPRERVVTVADDVDVLVLDGIFLHRPELRDLWSWSVFLDVDFDVSIPRGASRGYGDPDPAAPSNRRYVEGQRMYLRECRPRRHANCVIDNRVLADAHIVGGDRASAQA